MLGPEVERYGPNVKVVVIAFLLGALFCLPFWFGAKDANSRTGWAIFFAVASFFILLVTYLFSSRASLHVDGVSCRSIFGEKEMRWTEVERFRYSSHDVYARGIPLGNFYQIKLIDEHGSNHLSDRATCGEARVEAEISAKSRNEIGRLNRAIHDDVWWLDYQSLVSVKDYPLAGNCLLSSRRQDVLHHARWEKACQRDLPGAPLQRLRPRRPPPSLGPSGWRCFCLELTSGV